MNYVMVSQVTKPLLHDSKKKIWKTVWEVDKKSIASIFVLFRFPRVSTLLQSKLQNFINI